MKGKKTKTEKLRSFVTDNIVICKCGHSVFLPDKDPVKICSHCNNLVFKNDKEKFKFMLTRRKGLERG